MENGSARKEIPPAIWIATAPVLGYALGMAYEVGYARYFHMPLDMIVVTLSTILHVAGVLAMVFITSAAIAGFMAGRLDLSTARGRAGLRIWIMLFFTGPMFFSTGSLCQLQGWLLLVFGLILFGYAVMHVLPSTHKEARSLEEKHLAQERLDRSSGSVDFVDAWLGQALTWVLATGVILCFLAYNLGTTDARRQVNFLVIQEEHSVVLRAYGDRLVLAPYDPLSRTVRPAFRVVGVLGQTGGGSPQLVLTSVGPLKPVGPDPVPDEQQSGSPR